MSQEDGVRVVLSPVQLAAILADEPLSEAATLTNHLWGGLRVVGGLVELVGAGVLCLVPEPTLASKVGCVVFGVHGADTTAAGARQVLTGREVQSLVHAGTAALAQALGGNSAAANAVGVGIDIAVPLVVAGWVGAARIASIQPGRINLALHEAQANSRLGGHTILKHVGKTEAELRARLTAERGITASSSFSTLAHAERAISSALRAHAGSIQAWAKSGAAAGTTRNLRVVHDANSIIGHTVPRLSNRLSQDHQATPVLSK